MLLLFALLVFCFFVTVMHIEQDLFSSYKPLEF